MPTFEPVFPGDMEIAPLTPRIGAEIKNLRLSADLGDNAIASIEAALAKHKVLFFHDQQHLDDREQERFTSRFGELTPHPTTPPRAGTAAIFELDASEGGRADRWHTDVTFVDAYPKMSVLRAVVIPPCGGDTMWANTAAAYERLPHALKRFADELRAIHSNLYDYAGVRPEASAAASKQYEQVFTSTIFETEHPVVRVLPTSGERSLVLGNFVRRLAGYSQSDSNHVLEMLQSHVVKPENIVRWRWREGDVAIWDNTATQHCAINDYGDLPRVVRRSTVKGDIPVGVDGRSSILRRRHRSSPTAAQQVAA